MRLVRFLAVAVALACVAPTMARAQDQGGGPGGGRGGRGRNRPSMADQLKDAIGLTDDQVAKVQGFEDAMRAEMQKARDDNQGGDWSAMRDKMQAMRTKVQDQIRGILTDEQKPKFEDWVKKQDERRRNWGGPGGPGGMRMHGPSDKELLDRAEKELTLSPDEKAAVLPLVKKVLDARTEARKAHDARIEDLKKFLKDVPGTTDSQREEIAAKVKELRKARDEDDARIKAAQSALSEVLTPENEAKLIAMGIL